MPTLISIVVPCFNEQEVLGRTTRRLRSVLETVDWQWELLFVNDGSQDATPTILRQLASDDECVRVIHFSRNFGHQAAVSAGLAYAAGDAAVIIDADLQDPPEVIPEMVARWRAGDGDVIYGKRRTRAGDSAFKKASAGAFYRILRHLSDTPIPVDTGDFRLLDRRVIDAFNRLPERNKYIRGLIPWLGFRAVPHEYDRAPRAAGETKYPLSRMVRLASDGVLSFSRKPLQIATSLGAFNMFVSLALMVYVFISYFSASIATVPGWASTVLIIVFFSGIQLLTLGVLGAYIGRIFDEVKGRPEYVVAEINGRNERTPN